MLAESDSSLLTSPDIPAVFSSSGNTRQCHGKESITKSLNNKTLNNTKPVHLADRSYDRQCCANFSSASATTGYSYEKKLFRVQVQCRITFCLQLQCLPARLDGWLIDAVIAKSLAAMCLSFDALFVFSNCAPRGGSLCKIPEHHVRSENIDEVKRSRYWQVPSVRTFDFWTSRDL